MASLKWVKITTNITGDFKMNQLLDQPQGKRLLLAWILLICLAGELNKSGYFIKENQPLTIKDFKKPLKETTNFLNYSFKIFLDLGILGIEENTYYIVNWDKHQSEEKLEQRREKERLKKQRQRARKREKLLNVPGDVPPDIPTQNKKENKNQNQNIDNILLNNNPTFSYDEPTQPLAVANDLCVQPEHPLPPALTQTVDAYCNELSARDNPAETHTLLLAWLSSLQEKNRLPTTGALPLILEKLPTAAKQSRLCLPEYIQEVICRGWQSFYPVPDFGHKKNASQKLRSSSYDIDELEAMI